jgi:class 3 adenylate cyclase
VTNEGIIVTGGTINAGVMAAGHTVNVSTAAQQQEQSVPATPPQGASHHTIVCVDVKSFGDPARTIPHQVAVRDGLYQALETAFGQAHIPWKSCYHEDRGDGVLILVPAQIPKSDVAAVAPSLVGAVEEHNAIYNTAAQIRLRMAIHAGEVRHDDHGVAGTAVNLAFRLLEAAPLKQALDGATRPLALIVSGWFFDNVIKHDLSAQPGGYRPTPVSVKETSTTAWIRNTF